jgi:hypothetical protein
MIPQSIMTINGFKIIKDIMNSRATKAILRNAETDRS